MWMRSMDHLFQSIVPPFLGVFQQVLPQFIYKSKQELHNGGKKKKEPIKAFDVHK